MSESLVFYFTVTRIRGCQVAAADTWWLFSFRGDEEIRNEANVVNGTNEVLER